MGLYVEVMCDERKEWPADGECRLYHRCLSHNNENPQGPTVAIARQEAKRTGWVIRREYACCPRCKVVMAGKNSTFKKSAT
jgi:hypothetical protein